MATPTNNTARSEYSGWLLFPALMILMAVVLVTGDYAFHIHAHVLEQYDIHKYWLAPGIDASIYPGQNTIRTFTEFLTTIMFPCVCVAWFIFARQTDLEPSLLTALFSGIIFNLLYFISGMFQDYPMALYAVFMLVWAAQLALFTPSTARWVIFSVILGLAGAIAEGYVSESTGTFKYFFPNAYHVPIWLSGLYFNGAITIALATIYVESQRKKL